MSHTTTIGSIILSDESAIRQAAAELKSLGIDCELLDACTPRAYYSNQKGMEQADMVLKLNNSRYDVGFYKTGDRYEPRCDLWGRDIEKEIGVPVEDGVPHEQAAMGKFFQAYAVAETTNQMAAQGHAVEQRQGENGAIQLVVRT